MKKQSIASSLFSSNLLISFGTLLGAFLIWIGQFVYDNQQQNAHSIQLYTELQKDALRSETEIWSDFILQEQRNETQRIHTELDRQLNEMHYLLNCQESDVIHEMPTRESILVARDKQNSILPLLFFAHTFNDSALVDPILDSLYRLPNQPDSVSLHVTHVLSDLQILAHSNQKQSYAYRWWKPNQSGREHLAYAHIRKCDVHPFYMGLSIFQEDLDSLLQISTLQTLDQLRFRQKKNLFITDSSGNVLYSSQNRSDSTIEIAYKSTIEEGGGFHTENGILTYMTPLKKWNWRIGVFMSLSEIQTMSKQYQVLLQKKLKRFTLGGVFILILSLVLTFSVSYMIRKRMERNIHVITQAFHMAESHLIPIQSHTLGITEFERIANSANQLIEARAHIEEEREQLMHQLNERSKEFENILYIASHDLRAPLVNLIGFTNEFMNDLETYKIALQSPELPSIETWEQMRSDRYTLMESLRYITKSTKRMDAILNGLLAYSRMGRIAPTLQRIQPKHIADELINNLEFRIRNSHAKIIVSELPSCHADPFLFQQILQNIIDNAIKYAQPNTPPVIHLSGTHNNSWVQYRIQDNGVGIAPEDLQHIFDLFYRSDPNGKTKGDGLGLSLVKRMVNRMNGRIWATSQKGQGSVFYIELPSS